MDAAAKRRLIEDVEPYRIAQFQKEFYGIPQAARWRQIAYAMETLDIGYGVTADEVKAGDFVTFSRKATGHAAIFLNWVLDGDRVVGLRYRSSQANTNGVGDISEYFVGSGAAKETILPRTVYFGRLK